MGTWGSGLYSNDDALDIKEDIRDMLAYGWTPDAIMAELTKQHNLNSIDEETSSAWLAIADTMWNYGCMTDEIKSTALHIINEGIDLRAWADASISDRKKRQTVLNKLQEKLVSPQPINKKPHKSSCYHCEWPVGSVYAIPAGDGEYHAFIVVEEGTYKPNKYVPENECIRTVSIAMLYWSGHPDQLMRDISYDVPVLGTPVYNGGRYGEVIVTKRDLNPYDNLRNIIRSLVYCGQLSLELCQSITKPNLSTSVFLSQFAHEYEHALSAKIICHFSCDGKLNSLDSFQCTWKTGEVYALPAQTDYSLPVQSDTLYHAFLVVGESTYEPIPNFPGTTPEKTVFIAMLKWEGNPSHLMQDLEANVPVMLQTSYAHGTFACSLHAEYRPLGISSEQEKSLVFCGKLPETLCNRIVSLYSPLPVSKTITRFEYDYINLCNKRPNICCFSPNETSYKVCEYDE